MTKQDFILIADVLASLPDVVAREAVVARFAERLAETNPRFERARFIRAATNRKNEADIDARINDALLTLEILDKVSR